MSSSQQDLERAFRLIKRDETQEALQLVDPIVKREPDNVDAWWLLAYAASDPPKVREALITVLRLDPDYANAPRAREMLEKLNEEYPPQADELIRFPELQTGYSSQPSSTESFFESEVELDNPFAALGELAPAETHVETFDSAEFENENLFVATDNDPFAELDDDPFSTFPDDEADALISGESAFEPIEEDPFSMDEFDMAEPVEEGKDKSRSKGKPIKFEPEEALTDEDLAAREEKKAQRGGRGRRILRVLASVLIVLFIAAAALLLLTQADDEHENADPGKLQVVASDSTDIEIERAKVSATQELDTRSLGTEHRAVVATSDLGNTLFVEICSRPGPNMPQLIKQAMIIAAQEAPAIEGLLPAVGVNIAQCTGESQDTLFRAAAPVETAITYLGQANTAAEEDAWVNFQAGWASS